MTLIATWNVNSIKARLPNVLDWVKRMKPDLLMLQELKCVEEAFPALEFGDLGYNCAAVGQKTYNGVAILSRTPLEVAERALPGDDADGHARYIEAVTTTKAGTLRVASIYLPNGNPIGTEKFSYKLAWLERLRLHMKALLKLEEPTVLGGDYNVIPEPADAHDPAAWTGDALFQPESRQAFRRLAAQHAHRSARPRRPGQHRAAALALALHAVAVIDRRGRAARLVAHRAAETSAGEDGGGGIGLRAHRAFSNRHHTGV